ncbi:MAG: hydantoinase B/oxoprolinase family protein, partial [Nitrospinota bacterium]
MRFDPISLEIMWGRLLHITEEMWVTVLRTAVSTIIGAANDFGCELLDAEGRSIAHAYRSMPVFNMTLPNVVKHLLKKFPAERMRPGDVFFTNDPWLCAGHLPDLAVVNPVFYQDRLIGFVGSIANTSDIGGALDAKRVRDLHEEGILIPPCYLYQEGKPNRLLFEIIESNVRGAEMVLADIEAQVIANEVGTERLLRFLQEYELEDLSELSVVIRGKSEQVMREAIRKLPDGVYQGSSVTDGLGTPLTLKVRITIEGDQMHVDYSGSAPQVDQGGINCTFIYTKGHTYFPLHCLLTPHIPNNEGCFVPISVYAPPGSILNCTPPASVGSRVKTGWHIHTALFEALAQVLPDRIQAGNGLMNSLRTYGFETDGKPFNAHLFIGGGRGAGSQCDGLGSNMFPSSAANVPVEVFELKSPALVYEKELIADSGGAGKFRGYCGQRITVGKLPAYPLPLHIYLNPDRLLSPP